MSCTKALKNFIRLNHHLNMNISFAQNSFKLLLVTLAILIVCTANAQSTAKAPYNFVQNYMLQQQKQEQQAPTAYSKYTSLTNTQTIQKASLQQLMRGQYTDHTIRQTYFSCDDLALFCKIEVKLEKKARIPVKFRLGDVQYVDYIEGKLKNWQHDY